MCEFCKGKSWNFSKIQFGTQSLLRNFEVEHSISCRSIESLIELLKKLRAAANSLISGA